MEKSIEELQAAMQAGEVTSRQLVDIYLARIAAYDKQGQRSTPSSRSIPRRATRADALDAERRAGKAARPAPRHSGAGEGQLRNGGDADRGGLDRAGVIPSRARRVHGPQA